LNDETGVTVGERKHFWQLRDRQNGGRDKRVQKVLASTNAGEKQREARVGKVKGVKPEGFRENGDDQQPREDPVQCGGALEEAVEVDSGAVSKGDAADLQVPAARLAGEDVDEKCARARDGVEGGAPEKAENENRARRHQTE
jgi:hypothetical protein